MIFQQYTDRSWGLIHTRMKHEKVVKAVLESNGIPCYLPVLHKVRSRSRSSDIPMFRCYLFAAWGLEERFTVSYCHSIADKIETPIGCDTEIIKQMEILYKLEVLSETQHVSLNQPNCTTSATNITIPSGPLAGFSGTWKTLNGKKVLTVMLDIMGASVEATIDDPALI